MSSGEDSFAGFARQASTLLRAIAAYGLESQEGWPPQRMVASQPLSDDAWLGLLASARHERLIGFMELAVSDGALSVTESQEEELHRAHLESLCRDLICERHLIDVARALDRAGLDHRVLKGSAVAHLDYPDPALRSFADVDLLVRADEWDDAIAVLAQAGWQRHFSEPRPGFDRRFVKGVVLTRTEGDTRTELDLHRTLSLGPFGLRVQLADLWDGHDTLHIGGEDLRCLSAERRFLHACFHAVLGDFPPRLVPLRDIAQMSLRTDLDLEAAIDLARKWGAQAVVSCAVQACWTTLQLSRSTKPWIRACSLKPPRRETRALKPYLTPTRSYVRLCLAATRAIPRPSDKVRYLSAMAFPQRQFLASRYRSRTARWRAAAQIIHTGRARGAN